MTKKEYNGLLKVQKKLYKENLQLRKDMANKVPGSIVAYERNYKEYMANHKILCDYWAQKSC